MNDSAYGYGQQQPSDSASDFSVTSFIVEQMLGRVRTVVVVRVVAVTGGAGALAEAGRVDVTPLVNQVDGSGNAVNHGTILNCPYIRLGGGNAAVIVDPAKDDIGLLLVADRDISAVKSAKKPANPGSFRRFDLADGVYIGGILNGVPQQYVQFTATGIKIADKNGNVLEMKSGGSFVTGNLNVSGEVTAKAGTAGSVGLSTHRHAQPNDSRGDVEAPTAAPTAGT